MSTEFTTTFTEQPVIITPMCIVTEVKAANVVIGYVAINRAFTDNEIKTTVTPFTSEGLMDDEHCAVCAVKKLFSNHTGFSLKSISLAETGDNHRSAFSGLLASILLSATKR